MLSPKLLTAFNDQIKHELESAYLYAAMNAWFKSENFDGMAHWMEVQTKEEINHARKFFDHIFERGDVVELQPINILANKWASPLEAFKAAYEHEQFVTGKINNLIIQVTHSTTGTDAAVRNFNAGFTLISLE